MSQLSLGLSLIVLLRIKFAVFVILIFVGYCARAEKISEIQPQGYVTDLAQVIDPATKAKIEALCAEVEQKTGAQIALVTVRSLEGESKEDYAVDLYKHLGVGSKKANRGVLLLIAPTERQYRIEVGYGLEPVINDARAGDIGRAMLPSLRSGDYSAAALMGVSSLAQLIAADKGVKLTGIAMRQPAPKSPWPWWLKVLALIGVLWFIRAMARSVRRGGGGPRSGLRGGGFGPGMIFLPPMGGGWGGGGGFGGSSGGFSGGGGFGGFGGGLSGGGGAGGSW
ncbi:MAG: TPM domain-containing protein [Candidatus Korobacteraceae bacterium]